MNKPPPLPVKKTMSKDTKSEIGADEIIHSLPLSDIFIDYDWNVRSREQVVSNEPLATGAVDTLAHNANVGVGIDGLKISIQNDGQETPVIVRAIEGGKSLGGKKTDKKYELVAGFRRATAIEALQSAESKELAKKDNRPTVVKDLPDGHIRAVIRTLSPKDARFVNVRENTLRNNLTTPDLAKFVRELSVKDGMGQVQIGEKLGIDQGYISRLIRVAGLPAPIFDHWATGKLLAGLSPNKQYGTLTVKQMVEIADLIKVTGNTEATLIQRYLQILEPPTSATADDGNGGSDDPKFKKICDFAFKLGILARESFIVVADQKFDWAKLIGPKKNGFMLDCGNLKIEERSAIWDMAEDAYEKGVTKPAPKTESAAA